MGETMNRLGHDTARFFIGREVEHTPAWGQHTLFVVGLQTTDDIQHHLDSVAGHADGLITHIFFGANDSYHPKTYEEYRAWEIMITDFLDQGHWCSLDIPFEQVAEFNDSGLCEHHQFIPIIKVPVPHVQLWNYNTCVKIDDQDFGATNPGVWVHELRDLMPRDRFTPWKDYSGDQVID